MVYYEPKRYTMALQESFVDKQQVEKLNDKIYQQGYVDRADLMDFLTYITTNDALLIISEVEKWLQGLHDDPKFSKIVFPKGDIDAILGDLDSYGRVQPDTILQFKQNSSKTVPIS